MMSGIVRIKALISPRANPTNCIELGITAVSIAEMIVMNTICVLSRAIMGPMAAPVPIAAPANILPSTLIKLPTPPCHANENSKSSGY
jgi:hypothetical protein